MSLPSVIAGDSDPYLTNFASSIASQDRKLYLTFDHEQNGSWYPWDWYSGNIQFNSQAQQESEWIQAWNHVTGVIDQNATAQSLITWVWGPTSSRAARPSPITGPAAPTPLQTWAWWGLTATTPTPADMVHRFASSYTDVENASGDLPFMVSETGIPLGDSNATSQEENLISGAERVGAKAVFYFDAGSYVMTSAMQTAWLAGAAS